MGKRVAKQEKAPKACRECSNWKEVKEKIRVSELLAKAINVIEDRLEQDFKPTVGDFLKLVQLEKELDAEDMAKEIKVTWVEPTETSSSEK